MSPVLIVEDDDDIRRCVAEFLSLEGFRVLEARNGRDGLNLLESQRPLVVVLDLMMPVMSGWEFRAEQKLRPEVAGIPVIVVTGHGLPTADWAVEAYRVFLKPFDIDELIRTVHEAAARA